ncbi:hypothetical protein MUP05_06530 [Candidatus Bathyarchaeota archaeon]|jgi:intracellular sulfur oxidation DsrE/DsrF family protein|nr:hypothetical protein [Candidatus Bathyarchaeota archaeon]
MLKKDEIVGVLLELGLPYLEATAAVKNRDLFKQGVEELVCRKAIQVVNMAHAALGMSVPVEAWLRWDGK